MKYEVIKKDYKWKLIAILSIFIIIILAISFMTTRAKYKEVQTFNIVKGKIHYKPSDLNIIAMYQRTGYNCVCNDDKCLNCYESINEVPSGEYGVNTFQSYCEYFDTNQNSNVKDEYVTIALNSGRLDFYGITKKGTKCYVYLKTDLESPVINGVTISDKTSTSFKVTVNATDNIGISSLSYTVSDGTNTGTVVNVDITPTTSLTKEITINSSNSGGITIEDVGGAKIYTVTVTVRDEDGNSVSKSDVTKRNAEQVLALLHNLNSTIPETITSERSSFSNISTSSEAAIYRIADPMYTENNVTPYSYYWYGAVKNNWFKYGGHMWRIIRINGDGTLRLLYTGTISSGNTMKNVTVENSGVYVSGTGSAIAVGTDTSIYRRYKYSTSGGAKDDPSYSGWTYTLYQLRPSGTGTPSYAKTQIESWMADTTRGNLDGDTNIVSGKFCVDRSTKTKLTIGGSETDNTTWTSSSKPSTFYYGAYDRVGNAYQPSLACGTGLPASYTVYGTTYNLYNRSDDDIYNDRYGLITADEVVLAGGGYYNGNQSFYLNDQSGNGTAYWTMTPSQWDNGEVQMFILNAVGVLHTGDVGYPEAFKPVINLSLDNLEIEGGGLYNNPFTPVVSN